ncbi:MAG: DNA methyltransferase [Rickettsiales bacterium]
MLTREYIKELAESDKQSLVGLVENTKDSSSLIFVLENLGYLSKDFDGEFLLDLLGHKNPNVRTLAVKNIGKIKGHNYIEDIKRVALEDSNTSVRREAVSSIGRVRDEDNINFLVDMLDDFDPKIVCQAIRALLVFRGNYYVDSNLQGLINHDNEMVRSVIRKEYFSCEDVVKRQAHSESHNYLKNVVVHGDTLEVMNLLKDDTVHLTFTSPPYYNARDYSIYPSYQYYLDFLTRVFREVYRITKEGRFLILNTSPVIVPRISRAHSSKRYPIPFDIHHYLMEIGWEFIDDIIWLKPEASVKNRVGGFMQHRKPIGYKPNCVTEYLMVYRKKTEKLLDWNIKQYDSDVVNNSRVNEEFETTNVWKIDPCYDKVHSAVFPQELCRRVIKYYSYIGDLVFDPFAGSGTVGRVAKNLGRRFFLTEKDVEYFDYMKTKKVDDTMFDERPTKFLTVDEFKVNI